MLVDVVGTGCAVGMQWWCSTVDVVDNDVSTWRTMMDQHGGQIMAGRRGG